MKRHTKEDIDKALNVLTEARKKEESIVNKYSDNYKTWSKACDVVNRLRNKYNKIVSEYNYDNGYNSSGLVLGGDI